MTSAMINARITTEDTDPSQQVQCITVPFCRCTEWRRIRTKMYFEETWWKS